MLVLKRRTDEALYVGDARVIVLSVEGQVVRLGIEADPSVRVDRQEVRERMMRDTQTKGAESNP